MRKQVALLVAILSLLASAVPVLAAKNSIAVAGNASSYYAQYIGVYQVNSTIRSSEEAFYRAAINISSIDDDYATLTDLNYTLGDEKAVGIASKIRLLNSELELIQEANATYADGNYVKAWFNSSNLAATANEWGYIRNTTNTTFYIEYRLQPLDSSRNVSITRSNIYYTENVSYFGPTDLTLENVTLVYKPTLWERLQSIIEVRYDGVAVTNYTRNANLGILYDPTFEPGSEHFLTVKYTIPESRRGISGTPITPTPLPPSLPPEFWLVIAIGFIAIVILLVAIAYYWKR